MSREAHCRIAIGGEFRRETEPPHARSRRAAFAGHLGVETGLLLARRNDPARTMPDQNMQQRSLKRTSAGGRPAAAKRSGFGEGKAGTTEGRS